MSSRSVRSREALSSQSVRSREALSSRSVRSREAYVKSVRSREALSSQSVTSRGSPCQVCQSQVKKPCQVSQSQVEKPCQVGQSEKQWLTREAFNHLSRHEQEEMQRKYGPFRLTASQKSSTSCSAKLLTIFQDRKQEEMQRNTDVHRATREYVCEREGRGAGGGRQKTNMLDASRKHNLHSTFPPPQKVTHSLNGVVHANYSMQ